MPVIQIPERVPGRFLLVDGDYLAYYCGGSQDSETSPGESRQQAKERIEKMRMMSGSDKIVVHLTDPASHKGDRFCVATVKPYQGNRKSGTPKPRNWAFLRDWMQTGGDGQFQVKTWGDREADDGAAYHAMVLGPERTVMTCADKDWRMIPGWHLDWKTWMLTYMAPGTFSLDGQDGHLHGEAFFWWQLLRGDSADNIPGLPNAVIKGKQQKIGEKTADDYMSRVDNNTDAWKLVAALYRTKYGELWADALAEQMALLWMRRDKHAALDDCLRWLGPTVAEYMQPAFDRLIGRVDQLKKEAEAYGSILATPLGAGG